MKIRTRNCLVSIFSSPAHFFSSSFNCCFISLSFFFLAASSSLQIWIIFSNKNLIQCFDPIWAIKKWKTLNIECILMIFASFCKKKMILKSVLLLDGLSVGVEVHRLASLLTLLFEEAIFFFCKNQNLTLESEKRFFDQNLAFWGWILQKVT